MDIQTLSTMIAQSSLKQNVSTLALKSSMNQMKTQGADIINLIASSENSNSATKPASIGNIVDFYA